MLAALVCLSNQLTWSYAHAYHYFSPLGFFNGFLFLGRSGRPGPFGPAKTNLTPTAGAGAGASSS